MRNLAGIPTQEANEQVSLELKAAGIRTLLQIQPPNREVKATIVGYLPKKECHFGFQRAWYYWVVKASKPFPLDKILTFNSKWGEQARIWGFAGGRSNAEVSDDHMQGYFDCLQSWHIDTQDALEAFVAFANECYTDHLELSAQLLTSIAAHSGLIDGEFVVPVEVER